MNQCACHIPVFAVENGSSYSGIIDQAAESREESKTLQNNSENYVHYVSCSFFKFQNWQRNVHKLVFHFYTPHNYF